jgi:hypothetical protein
MTAIGDDDDDDDDDDDGLIDLIDFDCGRMMITFCA